MPNYSVIETIDPETIMWGQKANT